MRYQCCCFFGRGILVRDGGGLCAVDALRVFRSAVTFFTPRLTQHFGNFLLEPAEQPTVVRLQDWAVHHTMPFFFFVVMHVNLCKRSLFSFLVQFNDQTICFWRCVCCTAVWLFWYFFCREACVVSVDAPSETPRRHRHV